jgi:hypothetical protein
LEPGLEAITFFIQFSGHSHPAMHESGFSGHSDQALFAGSGLDVHGLFEQITNKVLSLGTPRPLWLDL